MKYNWELGDWPQFTYSQEVISEYLAQYAESRSYLSGLTRSLPSDIEKEALVDVLIREAMKTSEIEGEFMSREDVMSSIKKNLGISEKAIPLKDKRAEGVAYLMTTVRNELDKPLSQKMLFGWHKILLQWDKSINVGQWRKSKEPMQIVSGAIGREKIHFEAPPSHRVPEEMKRYVKWFNQSKTLPPPVRSAIAHLYFESIHPFEDGNGRIGRALAEKALMQTKGDSLLISLSSVIERKKKNYYDQLKQAQRTNEITRWVKYFVKVIIKAIRDAITYVEFIIQKAHFFDRFHAQMNKRQQKVVKKMFEGSPEAFEGGIQAKKYMSIAKTSKATATRDLQDLLQKGVIKSLQGGGRSTSYELNLG
jgi:Fic family protein